MRGKKFQYCFSADRLFVISFFIPRVYFIFFLYNIVEMIQVHSFNSKVRSIFRIPWIFHEALRKFVIKKSSKMQIFPKNDSKHRNIILSLYRSEIKKAELFLCENSFKRGREFFRIWLKKNSRDFSFLFFQYRKNCRNGGELFCAILKKGTLLQVFFSHPFVEILSFVYFAEKYTGSFFEKGEDEKKEKRKQSIRINKKIFFAKQHSLPDLPQLLSWVLSLWRFSLCRQLVPPAADDPRRETAVFARLWHLVFLQFPSENKKNAINVKKFSV